MKPKDILSTDLEKIVSEIVHDYRNYKNGYSTKEEFIENVEETLKNYEVTV